ncbi:CapA family protein [Citrobacter koseri]|uniref:CapA family protein n=1 Tax=Citrobacter TaxID=544 RepID=UPI000E1A54DB|nr:MULTISPECIES: CapA family protein [Citrobacter]MBJ8671097.1 CapA family protein [Citrobacter koseri]MBJ8763985.1 CapA family protein [Citrobacter koseri]MBJ9119872.1 CapA family protein [Citrobacter koseri]MBJ9228768.1 CapA family protein [Citrobacter koseri]MDM3003071.1 CapA family protein [Citrobacter sp. CK188]
MIVNIFGDVYFKSQDIVLTDSVEKLLKAADRNIVNFEAPVVDNNEQPREKVGAVLKHDLAVVEKLKRMSITDVCIANNHYYDYGIRAAENSSEILKDHGFVIHGEYGKDYQKIISDDGTIKVAIFNVAESEYGVSVNDKPGFTSVLDTSLYNQLAKALNNGFKVILIVHAGLENELSPLLSWSEIYRKFIDFGVCAVVAHHPHVPQRYEYYKDGVIYYSLGNFVFQGGGSHEYSNVGQCVSFKFDSAGFEASVYYTRYDNSTLDIYDRADELDDLLNHKVAKYHKVTEEEYNKYCKIDYKRFISAMVYKTPLVRLPFFKNRSKRQFDFHLHNLRFETHRFVQLEYLEDKLK